MDDIKISTLFRQSWYEAAKAFLTDQDRLQFYELCFNYAFFGKEPDSRNLPAAVGVLWFTTKPLLESDREKAVNIATRNKQNRNKSLQHNTPDVLQLEQPNSNLVKSGQTYTNTNTYTNTITNTVCVQEWDTHTKFEICIIFFINCAVDPIAEASRFWNYYETRNFELNTGQKIKNLVSVAKTWRISQQNSDLRRVRQHYGELLTTIALNHETPPFYLIQDFAGYNTKREKKEVVISFFGRRACDWIEQNCGDILKLWAEKTVPEGWIVTYQVNPILEP